MNANYLMTVVLSRWTNQTSIFKLLRPVYSTPNQPYFPISSILPYLLRLICPTSIGDVDRPPRRPVLNCMSRLSICRDTPPFLSDTRLPSDYILIYRFHLSPFVCLSDSSHPATQPGDAAFTVGWPTPLDLVLGARLCFVER
jgi:hypothetical protein